MKCPKCGYEQPDTNTECIKCQIVFEKWRARLEMEQRIAEREKIKEKDKQKDLEAEKVLEQKMKEKGIDPAIFYRKPEPAVKPVSRLVIYTIITFVMLMLGLVAYAMVLLKKTSV